MTNNLNFDEPRISIDFWDDAGWFLGYIEMHNNPKCFDVYINGDLHKTAYSVEEAKQFVKDYFDSVNKDEDRNKDQ